MNAWKRLLAVFLCVALVCPVHIALGAPTGGEVVGGQAQINQSGAATTINQSSSRSIINWRSFDIGRQESVLHNMPNAGSAGLHRVIGGGGASQIEGLLKSNGNIFLVNPAGIVIHNGARVETGGFVGSTADIRNEDFMRGNYLFNKPGQAGASIINAGDINVRESGFAALVAPRVRNDGVIAAKLGKVALASAESYKLDVYGDDLVSFTAPEKVVDTLYALDGTPLGVDNKGTIKAEGGTVLMTAKQLDGVVSSVVNNRGLVSASSAEMRGGKIVFKGDGANVDVVNTGTAAASSEKSDGGSIRLVADGKVNVSGTVEAKGANKGGSVVLTGKEVALTKKARIDASGEHGGGTVLVGGNALGQGPENNAVNSSVGADVVIRADAITSGNGGQVVVWSDGTIMFDGQISARGGARGGDGGWVETSGSVLKVGDTARVDTSAPLGNFGEWLLDPMDFTIAAHGGDMTGVTLSANLATGNVIILSIQGQSGVNGDIFVNDAVTWAEDTRLTLRAVRNVDVNADITATGGSAGLTIENGTGGDYNLSFGSKVTLSGATPTLYIGGKLYTVINSLAKLRQLEINPDLAGYYALGSDIDASGTSGWNSGDGFKPVGDSSNPFAGVFHGGGHTITGLTINRPTPFVGLFGYTEDSARISNVGIVNANIAGSQYVGALAGVNYGTISNSYSSGTVSGSASYVGGLVGGNGGTIFKSYSSGAVSGASALGGFVGVNLTGGTISNSYSTGAVTIVGSSPGSIGGFVGLNQRGTISNSYSTGAVNGGSSAVAGGLGIGGFVGSNMSGGVISNSYSTGRVTGSGSGGIGGFAGINSGSSITNSYWDIQTSGRSSSGGSGTTGLTTAQMKTLASFNGWDFTDIWSIVAGQSYPQLRNFQGIPTDEEIAALQKHFNFGNQMYYFDNTDKTCNWNNVVVTRYNYHHLLSLWNEYHSQLEQTASALGNIIDSLKAEYASFMSEYASSGGLMEQPLVELLDTIAVLQDLMFKLTNVNTEGIATLGDIVTILGAIDLAIVGTDAMFSGSMEKKDDFIDKTFDFSVKTLIGLPYVGYLVTAESLQAATVKLNEAFGISYSPSAVQPTEIKFSENVRGALGIISYLYDIKKQYGL